MHMISENINNKIKDWVGLGVGVWDWDGDWGSTFV